MHIEGGVRRWDAPLLTAVEVGDLIALRDALAGGAAPDVLEAGWTPLQLSLQLGREDFALTLLEAGAMARQTTPGHYTPLLRAAQRGLTAAAVALLEGGAEVDAQDMEAGDTPLIAASVRAHCGVIEALLGAGATLALINHAGVTALEAATRAAAGRRDPRRQEAAQAAVALLEGAADRALEAPTELAAALRLAAALGRLEAVEALLEAGADPEAPAPMNTAALGLAAAQGHAGVVARLLAAGADPSRISRRMLHFERQDFHDPVGWAVARRRVEVIAAFAEAGVSIDRPDPWGNTGLFKAAVAGHREVVEALLAAGADLQARNRRGQRPLEAAVEAGQGALAPLLGGAA